MSLPKIEVPMHTVRLTGIKKNVKYRSYTVKEEKILLMAAESRDEKEIMDTIIRLCQSCLLTKEIEIEDLSMHDMEKLLVSIRSKSVGESVKATLPCPECGETTLVDIDLENLTEVGEDSLEDTIMLNEEFGLILKAPSLKSVKTNITDTDQLITNAILSAIESVFDKENVYPFKDYTEEEKAEFVDRLSVEDARKITEGYLEKLPKNVIKLDYKCPHCGHHVKRELDNILDFFI